MAEENDWTRRIAYFWDMAWTSYVAANASRPTPVSERQLVEIHELY